MGTLINIIGIVAGGIIGIVIGNKLRGQIQDSLIKATGVAVLFVGIAGTLEQMIAIEDGAVQMNGSMMLIISIALGTVIGELIGIEAGFEKFGTWLKKKTGNEKDSQFVNGFVVSSLTVCVGAMAIVGAIQDGMLGDYSILAMKAILDFLIIMVLAASLGKGCIFSAIPVGILQGSVTILASFLSTIIIPAAISNLSLVGNVLIFCVGMNLIFPKTFRVANMLPSIVIAMILAYFGM